MTFREAKAKRDVLNATASACSAVLQTFPRGPMGLVSAAVRTTSEYQAARVAYDRAAQALRTFNASFVKTFKAELAAERKAKRP